jgi:hypothetical protein
VLIGQQYKSIWYTPRDPFNKINITLYKIKGVVGIDMIIVRLTLLSRINQVVDSKVGADFSSFTNS